MSHEFKTPIATINLAIDAIESQLEIKNSKKTSISEDNARRK